MRWKDIPQMAECYTKCEAIGLEKALNNKNLLIKIHKEARRILGIGMEASIDSDIIIEKLGEVVIFNPDKKFDANKLLALIAQEGSKQKACFVLGGTIVCLMEAYGLINEGPRL